jgi:antitoxin (DNA-binding transcriptional repressor) of toxin-antitoxin stability system
MPDFVDSERRRQLFQRNREKRARALAAARPRPAVAAREVTMTELDRRAAAIVRGVRMGEVAVVSKHRRAVAMIVPLDDELALVLRDPTQAQGMAELIATFRWRDRNRHMSALMHGRWYGKVYRRYRYRRRR